MLNHRVSVFIILTILAFTLWGSMLDGIAAESTLKDNPSLPPTISFTFFVTNIDQSTKTVNIEGACIIQNISSTPVLHCMISGVTFECTANSEGVYLGSFNCTYTLDGSGDLFPFDAYTLTLRFNIIENVNMSVVHVLDQKFLNYNVQFSGVQKYALMNAWKSDINGFLPTVPSATSNEIYVSFNRTENAFKFDFMIFLLPIIAIYYFLGSTLIVDSKHHLNERLAMYVALLFFVPLYVLSIQTLMPYRSSVSFPEVLLINLLISTTILTVCSLIGKNKSNTSYSWQKPELAWDTIGVAISLIVLVALYLFTMPPLTNQTSFLFIYGIMPAYCFWMAFKVKLSKDIAKQFTLGFLTGLVISITFSLASLFFNLLISQFAVIAIGSFIAGLSFSAFMPNRRICLPLAFVSAILWTIISGAYVGGFFGGLPQAASNMLSFGILGGVFAVFTIGGAVIGQLISESRFKKKIAQSQCQEID